MTGLAYVAAFIVQVVSRLVAENTFTIFDLRFTIGSRSANLARKAKSKIDK